MARDRALVAPGPNGPLGGVLAGPARADAPAVLIIPGSGPVDRDGNNPHGLKTDLYRLIAEGLAARGVATLRIDKRGLFSSAGAIPDADAVRLSDYVEDVRAWTAVLRMETGVPCVWLLGHSEGGLVALAAVSELRDVCGLLLVATPGKRVGDTLREQFRASPNMVDVRDEAMAAVAELEAGRRVDDAGLPKALRPLFRAKVQDFLIDLFRFDPPAALAGYRGPVLILQGGRDIQVAPDHAERLKAANPGAELALLPEANHVLKRVASDGRTANLATYADPRPPLAPGAVEALAGFVTAPGRPGRRFAPTPRPKPVLAEAVPVSSSLR